MENRQRLFIYDRKEIFVLLLLGLLVAVFAFTLGLHLGKRVEVGAGPAAVNHSDSHKAAETVPDQVPHAKEFEGQTEAPVQQTDEVLKQALHDEVTRTGIQLEQPRQVDLPENTRREAVQDPHAPQQASKEKSATKSHSAEKIVQDPLVEGLEALRRQPPPGDFTLQLGVTQAGQEVRDQVEALEALGLQPFVRATKQPENGVVYQVYLGGFPSKEAAQSAGEKYRGRHMIERFEAMKSPAPTHPYGAEVPSHAE
jgi:hypothetical protein